MFFKVKNCKFELALNHALLISYKVVLSVNDTTLNQLNRERNFSQIKTYKKLILKDTLKIVDTVI